MKARSRTIIASILALALSLSVCLIALGGCSDRYRIWVDKETYDRLKAGGRVEIDLTNASVEPLPDQ